MAITGLGHVGLHVNDLDAQAAFYEQVVGLTITDRDPEVGMVFLSARPDEEHHELLLCGGRTAPPGMLMLQQVSFHCSELDDMIAYDRRFREHGVHIDMVVTHGNAIGIYFYDPEGNRCEVYWKTGLEARQPFLADIDLSQPPAAVMARVRDLVEHYGATGHIEHAEALTAQNI
jgi:catechol-2,3-dioxygenase